MNALAVSVAEAARMVGLDQTTIRAAINARALPAKRHGRKILVPVAGLQKWLDALEDASPEDGAA